MDVMITADMKSLSTINPFLSHALLLLLSVSTGRVLRILALAYYGN